MEQNKRKRNAGFTLLELCIVIALTAIVASMTVLFATLISKRTTQSNVHAEVLTSISNMETGIKQWIMHYDNSDYRIEIASGTYGDRTVLEAWDTKGTASTSDDKRVSQLCISENGEALTCGGVGNYRIRYIRSVQFSKKVADSNGGTSMIITCDVSYYDPNVKEDNKYSNTRIIFSTHAGTKINY